MRIYPKHEFLNLPVGTVFCKGTIFKFEDICIKRMSCGHGNFYYQRFNWIEASSDHEAMERLGEMLDNKASYPMEDAIAQDGMLDDCEIFLVFEKSDLEKLIMKLFLALKDAY